ncbi:MAG TPA: segregation/condensation protein A [Candidatus Binataceae bacterium]|nr:segregation/condensation protein A [Candidatus Binataceae bacterium]
MSDEGAPAGFDGGGVRFRLPIYEGPLDLLLHLVKRAELSAQDVTTRIITEQYLEHLNLMEQLNLDVAGEYLVMAATLLLIKSFALLPHPQIDDTDEGDELKRDLVERLLEYQRYREAAAKLGERPLLGRDVFAAPRQAAPAETAASAPYAVSIFDLVSAMAAVLKRLGDRTPRRIELRDIPVAHCIPRILAAIGGSDRIEFIALFDDLADRQLIIATFMALLELIRRGAVHAWQDERHGPIMLGRGERYTEPHPAADVADGADEAPGADGGDDDRGGEERGA